MSKRATTPAAEAPEAGSNAPVAKRVQPVLVEPASADQVAEIGGPTGPEPTRFGDWERKGRCIDF